MRWEFGFACAFCLLHESDLAEHGAEGLGVTGVEHFLTVSAQGDVNRYENCFYACRFCNGARRDSPLKDGRGRRLLNPCSHVWAEHFIVPPEADHLLPVDGDGDAIYTHGTYDLDDPRKVEIRRLRRERMEEWLQILKEGPELLDALMERLLAEPEESRAGLLRVAEQLRGSIDRASRDLHRYAVIPRDADVTCRCGRNDHHQIPAGWPSRPSRSRCPDPGIPWHGMCLPSRA